MHQAAYITKIIIQLTIFGIQLHIFKISAFGIYLKTFYMQAKNK